jgi:hypothetical protein
VRNRPTKHFGKLGTLPAPRGASRQVSNAPPDQRGGMGQGLSVSRGPLGAMLVISCAVLGGVLTSTSSSTVTPDQPEGGVAARIGQTPERVTQRPGSSEERVLNRAVNNVINDREVQDAMKRMREAASSCVGDQSPFCARVMKDAADDYGRAVKNRLDR